MYDTMGNEWLSIESAAEIAFASESHTIETSARGNTDKKSDTAKNGHKDTDGEADRASNDSGSDHNFDAEQKIALRKALADAGVSGRMMTRSMRGTSSRQWRVRGLSSSSGRLGLIARHVEFGLHRFISRLGAAEWELRYAPLFEDYYQHRWGYLTGFVLCLKQFALGIFVAVGTDTLGCSFEVLALTTVCLLTTGFLVYSRPFNDHIGGAAEVIANVCESVLLCLLAVAHFGDFVVPAPAMIGLALGMIAMTVFLSVWALINDRLLVMASLTHSFLARFKWFRALESAIRRRAKMWVSNLRRLWSRTRLYRLGRTMSKRMSSSLAQCSPQRLVPTRPVPIVGGGASLCSVEREPTASWAAPRRRDKPSVDSAQLVRHRHELQEVAVFDLERPEEAPLDAWVFANSSSLCWAMEFHPKHGSSWASEMFGPD